MEHSLPKPLYGGGGRWDGKMGRGEDGGRGRNMGRNVRREGEGREVAGWTNGWVGTGGGDEGIARNGRMGRKNG